MKLEFTVHEDRVLGEGVLGTLHEGMDCSTRHPVTITVLRPEFTGNPVFSRRFHREITRASRIIHPHILRTYGSGVWKGNLFCATEALDGKEGHGPLGSGSPLEGDDLLKIAQGCAGALKVAEHYRITPLHLRKAGLSITREGTLKVGEIGLARILDTDAEYQRVVPFTPYLSPERARGQKADVRSDLFALGVILYELATGRPPFEGHESKTSYLYQLLNEAPVPPREVTSTVPRELDPIILRCLAKDPDHRYQNASEILDELLAVRQTRDRGPSAVEASQDESGDFEINEEQIIGEGGMGTLYRGRQKSLDRVVAIKVIRNLRTANPGFRKQFRREAELLAQVRDGNVVQIFGAGPWKGRLFYAMELVEGQDLRARVAQGPPLTLEEILHIGQGVGRALRAAWSHKIVHRDIKPSNILLVRDGTIKVTDFGLATRLRLFRPESRFIVGTLGYLSPEQGTGEEVDIRSDLYSLGIVLFELASGRLPFAIEGSPGSIRKQHPFVAAPPVRGHGNLLPTLDAIIQRCLATSPAHRFQSPDEFLDAVQSAIQLLWVDGHPPSTIPQKVGTWMDHPLPSPDGARPRSVHEVFELAMALGDYENAVGLAEREFGRPSKEYQAARERAQEAEFRDSERAALHQFLLEDWAGAAAAYRELAGRTEVRRQAELLLAVDYCEHLAGAQASGRGPDLKDAILIRSPKGRTLP